MSDQLRCIDDKGILVPDFILREEHTVEEIKMLFTDRMVVPIMVEGCRFNVEVGQINNLYDTESIHIAFIVEMRRDIQETIFGIILLQEVLSGLAIDDLKTYLRVRGGISGIRAAVVSRVQGTLEEDPRARAILATIEETEGKLEQNDLLDKKEFYELVHQEISGGSTLDECISNMLILRTDVDKKKIPCIVEFKKLKIHYLLDMLHSMDSAMGRVAGRDKIRATIERDYELWCECRDPMQDKAY